MITRRSKSAAWWLIAAVVVGLSFLFDDAVIAFVNARKTPAVSTFGAMGSLYGQLGWLLLPCAITAIVAWFRRDGGLLRIVCIMVIAASLAGLGANVIRTATGRTRPNAPERQGWYGPRAQGTWIFSKYSYSAFPSAHAAAAMGLIAPLLLMRKRAGWLLLPVPAAIAAARICAGAHHLSDVLAGALLGFAVACWVQQKIAPRIMHWRIFECTP